MKRSIILLLGGATMLTALRPCNAQDSSEPSDVFGAWWRGGQGAAELKQKCPWVRGVFAALKWSRLEPQPEQFDWEYFDSTMAEYARAGLYIQFMVWVGPDSPRWIYENGVPEVKTTPSLNPRGKLHTDTYPFYLNENYQTFYWRMIRQVAERIDTLPPGVRKRIICIQTAEGTTGDEGGYKGKPLDPQYALPEPKWREFKFKTWKLFAELYWPKQPKIHILVNSGNQGQYHDWLMENMPDTWRKAGNPGHGYQLNDEMSMFRFLDPIINHFDDKGRIVRCRSEMDEMFKGWFQEAPLWNMYWLNLWCSTFGIDIFQHNTGAFSEDNAEGFIFYDKYGGQKDPATSPGAWCALRDGLDAGDTKRFPVEQFGPGKFAPSKKDQSEGIQRCMNIIQAFEKYGAKQGDPAKGMALIMQNRDAKAMNDVGWNIWPGNYGNYLEQYDPNGTSQGWWRVGPMDQPYGRFARSFDVASGKNRMCFDLDDQFFAKDAPGPRAVVLRVVYFDQGKGSWALKYDATDSAEKTALEATNADTGRWKEAKAAIADGRFENRCPNKTDLMLVNTSQEDTIFHMVEVTRGGGN
ncbi:MAG: beta-galactosidase [Candidatus Sumerlaeota bacterium]|nr:beta-galactosidase [Candidatus Sumerlaeota bacterium]